MNIPWWSDRHAGVLARVRQGKVDLVFLGDSITQDFERTGPPDYMNIQSVWNLFYGDRNAVNMGFSGDATAHLLWRIRNGELDGISPKAAVVLIGANNFGRLHWSAEDTARGIEAIVDELRRKLPQMRILLLGVLPSDRGAWTFEATRTLNRMLAARWQTPRDNVTFLDVGHVLMRDGAPDPRLFYDSLAQPPRAALHPSAEGWRRIAEAIEPALSGMMGDRNKVAAR